MRHHRSAHINAPYETVYVSGTDGVSWEASPGFHLRSCRVYGKNAVKTYAGYNLINNNSFVPVKTSSSVSARYTGGIGGAQRRVYADPAEL
mgnify:CR=1 FL=1